MAVSTTEELIEAQDLARTYSAGSYNDPWELVQDYQRVLEYQARHPNLGSTAVGNALELPRSRVRSWLDGGIPDPLRGIQRAETHGWLDLDPQSDVFRGLNVLTAWVFSGGSIEGEWYVPRFAVDGEENEERIDCAFEAVGIEYDFIRSSASNRATEYRPKEDGSILGRILALLGAPIGVKNEGSRIQLPNYLDQVPEPIGREFAITYLGNRGQRTPDKGTVTFREERSRGYLRSLASLFRECTGEQVTVSEKNVVISAAAADVIDRWPPVLETQRTEPAVSD